ncbi:peptidylprolyl isomerase [candidate division KSB1 bacterium]|nr:peptidylprolyl isomerase [candidate division KSB1 bacterium]
MKIKSPAMLLVLLFMFSCSMKQSWVIGVGNQKLSVDEALEAFKISTPQYRSTLMTDSTVLAFCKIRFARQLFFLHEAEQRGIEKEDSIQTLIRRNNVNAMTAVHGPLYDHAVQTVKPPTAKMLHDMYDKRKYEYHLAHILVPDPKTADSLARALEAGTLFSELVKEYSIDHSLSDEKGVWKQWYVYGTMGGDFDNLIVKMAPTIPAGPVLSRYGWHIVSILKKRARKDLPFEKVVNNLERLYVSMEETRRWIRYKNAVPEKLIFTVNADAVALVSNRYIKSNNTLRSDLFTAAELQTQIASFRNGVKTLDQFIDAYLNLPSLFLPPLNRIEYVKAAVQKACLQDMMFADALAFKLDQDPEYRQNTRRYRERLLLAEVERRMYQPFDITDAEIRETYETEPEFKRYPFEEMESWVHRYLTGKKKSAEEQRQYDLLKTKYKLQVNKAGVQWLVKAMNEIVSSGQSEKDKSGH